MERICRTLGFAKVEIVEANDSAGDLCLMWSANVELEVIWKSEHLICGNVLGGHRIPSWSMLTCYGPPYYREKNDF